MQRCSPASVLHDLRESRWRRVTSGSVARNRERFVPLPGALARRVPSTPRTRTDANVGTSHPCMGSELVIVFHPRSV